MKGPAEVLASHTSPNHSSYPTPARERTCRDPQHLLRSKDTMNSKQRRQHLRDLERRYGPQLTLDLATARLLGHEALTLTGGIPEMWSVNYIVTHRHEALQRIAVYDQAHRVRPPA